MIKDIVLDLDETLIHGVPLGDPNLTSRIQELKRVLNYKIMEDQSYIIFERPYVRSFLNYACSIANVSVWTAASQTYGNFIVRMLFDEPYRQCKAFFHRDHCMSSEKATGYLKSLEWLSSVGAVNAYPHHTEMILVDDRSDIALANPHTAIVIDAFVGNPSDVALRNLAEYLKTIVHSNVLMETD